MGNNINTIKHFADHLAKMNKTLVFILLGLVTMVLSANEEENQTKELREAVDGNSLEVERVQREAEPRKKKNRKHHRKGNKAKKQRKMKKGNKAGRRHKKGNKKSRKAKKKQGKSKRKMKKGKNVKNVKGKGARKGKANTTTLEIKRLLKRDSLDQLPARLLMLEVVTPLTCPAAETKPTQEPQNSSPSSPLSRNVR